MPIHRFTVSVIAALSLGLPSVAPVEAQQQLAPELQKSIIERRVPEAVIWGMPAVNYELMRQQLLTKTPGKVGEVIYWGRPLDWHNQTLTPNPDAIYFMTFFSTSDGPVVIEVPPAGEDGSLNANIVTVWQMPLEDAGAMGVDKGAGGKFLVLPPGYAEAVPEGYYPLQSDTFGGYALLRSNLVSHTHTDVAKSVAYGKRIKVYPLSAATNPPETVFHDVQDVEFDSTIRYDASFFADLDHVVQAEPWITRDKAMIDQLKSLGIEKGKAFAPTEETKALLEAGIKAAQVELAAKYDLGFPPFWDNSRWMSPGLPEVVKEQQAGFSNPDAYPVDGRGLTYTYAYIGIKHLGTGQMYLISIKDSAGNNFDGASTYKLTVPPEVPVKQYWSVTAYDRETHALIKNMDRASRSSNAKDVVVNADGSVDVLFGPEAPEGKDSNWVPTDPERGFELMFRLYGPTENLFDKSWVLPAVEKVE
jgi:hypothetical protein